jgi:hypothetical protein
MARDITVNINDADDAILVRLTDEFNAAQTAINPAHEPESPAQFFRGHARGWIRSHRTRFTDQDNTRLKAVYDAATVEEKATIDAIRARVGL